MNGNYDAQRKDALDSFFESVKQENAVAEKRRERARQLTRLIASRFLAQVTQAADRMNPRLNPFGIQYKDATQVGRWHYPKRITARDLDAKSFSISLHHHEDGVIGKVLFAVLAPNIAAGDQGVEVLAGVDMSGRVEVRHYAGLRDGAGIHLIIESELLTCAAPELNAMLGNA